MNADSGRKGKGRPRGFNREEALNTALRIFWREGYEPASVAELCAGMGINPPSLYATFGNKAALFLEAVRHYEAMYWDLPAKRFMEERDFHKALANFFNEAAEILLSPSTPCGCMLVLAAINISENEHEIIAEISEMRKQSKTMFVDRLRMAINDGQIPADTNVPALACALNTMLEGMSLQARDGLFLSELKEVAAFAIKLVPAKDAASRGCATAITADKA